MIVCTHSHADHSPGAAPLQALVAAHGRAAPPILGLPSAPTARAASHFVPDRVLSNGELLALTGQGLEGEITHTLEVVHTPGHAANHSCCARSRSSSARACSACAVSTTDSGDAPACRR